MYTDRLWQTAQLQVFHFLPQNQIPSADLY